MTPKVRARFWFEAGFATLAGVLGALTAVWPRWVELLSGSDPDAGSGAVEWAVVAVLVALSVVAGLFARVEWRRVPVVSASGI